MEELWFQVWPYIRDLNEIMLEAEVVAPSVGLVSTLLSGFVIHRIQVKNAKILPFIPSYSETMVGNHNASTRFYASVHDMAMSVTEAWNTMNSRSQDKGSVEEHLDRTRLQELCGHVHEYSKQMRQDFRDYDKLDTEVARCVGALDDSWSYTTRDNYRTEVYTETTTDSDGNPTMETKTREVYDNTDHYFNFSRGAAKEALQSMERIQGLYANADLNPPRVAENQIDIARLEEVERMFLKRLFQQTIVEDLKHNPTDEELTQAANQWLVSTEVDSLLTQFEQQLVTGMERQESAFRDILQSNRSYHYNTTSRSHSGPRGYRAAHHLRSPLYDATSSWNTLESVWSTCQDTATSLREWVSDSEIIERDKAYAKKAIKAYEQAFLHSTIKIDQLTKPGKTLLFSLLIGFVTTALAFAAHPNGLASEFWQSF